MATEEKQEVLITCGCNHMCLFNQTNPNASSYVTWKPEVQETAHPIAFWNCWQVVCFGNLFVECFQEKTFLWWKGSPCIGEIVRFQSCPDHKKLSLQVWHCLSNLWENGTLTGLECDSTKQKRSSRNDVGISSQVRAEPLTSGPC